MKPLVSYLAAKQTRLWFVGLALFGLLLSAAPIARAAVDPNIRIAIAYDVGGLGDNGVNDAAALGLKAVQKKYHLSPLAMREVVTSGTPADREARIKFLAKAGYNLIIAVGSGYASAIYKTAQNFPEQQFAILGDSTVSAANVSDMDYATPELSFLAGALAAASSKSGLVAMLGSASDSTFDRNQKAFIAGANFAAPKVKVSSIAMPNNPTFYVKGLVAQGVDVIYSTWSSTSEVFTCVGVIAAAKKPIKLIGLSPDQYFLNAKPSPTFLLGIGNKNYGLAISNLTQSALNGSAISHVLDEANGIFGLRYRFTDGGLSFTSRSNSASVNAKIAAARSYVLKNGAKL